MEETLGWPDFHDSLIQTISLDWEDGVALIRLKMHDLARSKVTGIYCYGLISLNCPRRLSWGFSKSVNHLHLSETPEGTTLTIEMQSGDELTFTAERFELKI